MVVEKLELERIKFLNGASGLGKIDKGYSGAAKFAFEKDGQKYFLKIGEFAADDGLEQILTDAAIPHPAIIEMGQYDEALSYVIEKFVEGENLKDAIDKYSAGEMYNFGREIGGRYRNLRKVYPDQLVLESLREEYARSTGERVERLKNLLDLDKVVSQADTYDMLTVADFLQNSLPCVKDSLMVYGHTDTKPSNFLLCNGKVVAMDIENTRYKEITASMMWAYARVDYKDEKNLAFARGYLDGLFDYNVPIGVRKCCNHNYTYNMVGYFVKYLEREDHERLERLLRHIETNYLVDGKIEVDKYLRTEK